MRNLRRFDRLSIEQAAFHRGPLLVFFGEIGQHFGRGDGIVSDDDAGRSAEARAGEAALINRAERQRVLDDDVVDAGPLEGGGGARSSASR